MKNSLLGKKFICAIIFFIMASLTVCYLKFTSETYLELVKWICGTFFGAQALTDIIDRQKGQ